MKTSPASGGLRPSEPPTRRPPYKPSLGGPLFPPEKIPAGANVNNAFFAIFLRNLFEIFENFLKISKECVFRPNAQKLNVGFVKFFDKYAQKSIFSNFINKIFIPFLKFCWKFRKIFSKIFRNFVENFLEILLHIFENFFENFWKFLQHLYSSRGILKDKLELSDSLESAVNGKRQNPSTAH